MKMRSLKRRLLLGSGAAGLLVRPPRAWADAPAPAPKRQVLTANMSQSLMHKPVQISEISTYTASLPIETGSTAIRIGLANNAPAPYRVDGICVSQVQPGGGQGQWIPAAQPGWANFSFGGGKGVTVPGNHPVSNGAKNVPAILWSDWLDYRTAPTAYRPQLELRALVPPQTMPMAVLPNPKFINPPLLSAHPRDVTGGAAPGDFVTNPALPLQGWAEDNISPVFVIQYRADVPGIQMVIGGDSHLAMWNTFPRLAAFHLSTPTAPISTWDAAWGGAASRSFWPALDDAIDDAKPSITVIQGWTANDGMKPAKDEAYLTRVKESSARTIAAGGIPIIVKGLPRHLYGKPELASWQAINQQLGSLVAGALVFDPSPYVEDPAMPGNWIRGLSDDGVHPNQVGNVTLCQPFEQLIAPLIA
jgi:hypothetical protein